MVERQKGQPISLDSMYRIIGHLYVKTIEDGNIIDAYSKQIRSLTEQLNKKEVPSLDNKDGNIG